MDFLAILQTLGVLAGTFLLMSIFIAWPSLESRRLAGALRYPPAQGVSTVIVGFAFLQAFGFNMSQTIFACLMIATLVAMVIFVAIGWWRGNQL